MAGRMSTWHRSANRGSMRARRFATSDPRSLQANSLRPTTLTLQARRDRLYPFMRLLIALIFIATVTANSLAGVSHQYGQGGCPMKCCRSVGQVEPVSSLSRVCCATHCQEPAGTQGSSATTILSESRHKTPRIVPSLLSLIHDSSTSTKKFPESPAANLAESSSRYLETCALLI